MFNKSEVPSIIPDEGITWNLETNRLTLYTNTWRVVWYESPTGHRFCGIEGDGEALIRYLKVVDSRGNLLKLAEDKWRWLQDNPMFMRGYGKITKRDVQRGLHTPEGPEKHEKLVFGQPLPDTGKKKRRARK